MERISTVPRLCAAANSEETQDTVGLSGGDAAALSLRGPLEDPPGQGD